MHFLPLNLPGDSYFRYLYIESVLTKIVYPV